MKFLINLILLLFITLFAFAQDYTFEIPEMEKEEPQLELSGNLNGKWILHQTDKESPFYKLKFYNPDDLGSLLVQYKMELYFNGDYQHKNIGLHLKTYSEYLNETEADFTLFEAYNSVGVSPRLSFEVGKRAYNWGKGYAFNPVGFINPKKDPENPELTQAGILSSNFEYIKSFDSDTLRTFAVTGVVIPPLADLNGKYGEINNTDLALKSYFLLWDTDVDILAYYRREKFNQIGIDLSKNLKENIEVHGEVGYFTGKEKSIVENNNIRSFDVDGISYLLGFRYLNRWGSTFISEYYHNDAGLNENEYKDYFAFLEDSYDSGNEDAIRKANGYMKNYFNSKTLMRDYVYLKITHPEPFDILYLTLSPSVIYNLNDNSFLLSPTLSYKPYTNFELLVRNTVSFGGDSSEFGGKQYQRIVELWVTVYF